MKIITTTITGLLTYHLNNLFKIVKTVDKICNEAVGTIEHINMCSAMLPITIDIYIW